MSINTAEPSSNSADPFYVRDDVKITVNRHRFAQTGTYQADVRVTGNTVSGGGTRNYVVVTWGYRIQVQNVGDEPRRYYFEWEIFSDDKRSVLAERGKITTDVLRPGQITYVSIEVRGRSEQDLRKVLLTKVQIVKESENLYIAESKAVWDIWEKTYGLQITGAASAAARTGGFLLGGCLGILVLIGIVVGSFAFAFLVNK